VDVYGWTGASCQLPVGEIYMDFALSGDHPLFGDYYITFTDGNKERNCVDFLSYHWEKITPKDWWNPNVSDLYGGLISVGGSTIYAGKQEYAEELYHCPTELTMDNIAKACHDVCKDDYCTVYMVFRDEY
ncbi:MAG: hypothetical protein MJ212_01255, partial [Alphaproteobacteria bacterium]|nr:hypothetical protein [Alphaproteobacteria bacterium]